MAETIDEITINFEEDGVQVVKELEKEILTRGGWTTIIFRYQQWEPAKEAYSADHYTIRRYRKMKGSYSQQSKFNISNKEQAGKLAEVLLRWSKD
ncbi:MAG: hypothetical protein HGA96_14115 [Desulfobulbaceae bacterium]|nr:hypothetical protein [Desulfobulbaceae bacterium]